MEHAFVDGAVAEETDGDLLGTAHLGRQGRPGGYRNACAHDAEGAQHTLTKITQVHGAAHALAGAVALGKHFGHHQVQGNILGNAMAVAAVVAGDVVILVQGTGYAHRHRFLAGSLVHRSGHFGSQEQII